MKSSSVRFKSRSPDSFPLLRDPDAASNRGLRRHWERRDGGVGRARRLDRLAMPAPFRQQRVFLRPSWQPGTWKVADRAGAKRHSDHAAILRRHSDPRNNLHDGEWVGLSDRFHVPARRGVRAGPHRQGPSGPSLHADRTHRAVRLRLHCAVGISAGGWAASIHCRPGQIAARQPGSDARRGSSHRRRFHRRRGRRGKLRSQLVAVVSRRSSAALRGGTGGGAQTSQFLLDWMGDRFQAAGTLGRRRSSLAFDVEGARALGDWRHCRRRHDVAARKAGRPAQLGLSILLASGRDVHPLCADRGWLSRRGEGVARMAPARGGWRARRPADCLRRRGRATA